MGLSACLGGSAGGPSTDTLLTTAGSISAAGGPSPVIFLRTAGPSPMTFLRPLAQSAQQANLI